MTGAVSLDGESWAPVGRWTAKTLQAAAARDNWQEIDLRSAMMQQTDRLLVKFVYASGKLRLDIERVVWARSQ